MIGVHAMLAKPLKQPLPEHIIPDAADHVDARSTAGKPGGGNRLIRSFAAGIVTSSPPRTVCPAAGITRVRQTRSMLIDPITTMSAAIPAV
jgi:hypothetical protein